MKITHLFSILVNHIEAFAVHGGYIFLFVATVLEGIPLIGMIVPGHITIVISGFLVRVGVLNIYIVLGISIFGAIMGDFIGFSLGRKYGFSFIDKIRPYFFIKDEHINRAMVLLAKHTGKAMIIGRFSPVTRALMPFLVGASDTHIKKFWLFNIIGGASWTISSVLIGYLFGAGYQAAAGYFGKLTLVAIIASLLIAWGYRFVNIRFHVFRRYELFALGLNVLSLWALTKTIQDAFSLNSFMANFDIAVNVFMAEHVTPFIATLANIVTNAGGTAVTGILGLLTAAILAYKKKWRFSGIMFLSMASTGLFVESMKAFFTRVRPDNALRVILNDPSFPSGHAALAAAFFIAFIYIIAPWFHSWVKRELVIVLCVLAVIVIGLSRVVLNVHWASDVVAGWSLGVFCATASILFVRYAGMLVVRK